MKATCFVYISILVYFFIQHSKSYRQEHATIKYYNPKYVKDVRAITKKTSRYEPYKTNFTITTLVPFGNNLTFSVVYSIGGFGTDVAWKIKLCDIKKNKWIADFLLLYASLNINCPMPLNTYRLINVEIPPKNFPLPLPKGDTNFLCSGYITDTQELVAQLEMRVRLE